MLNTYAPKFICWNSNSQGDGIRRLGIWEVIRTWRWGPHDWNCGFIKQNPQKSSLVLSTMRGHNEKSAVWTKKRAALEPDCAITLIQTSSLQSCEQYVSAVCKPPSRWYFVRAAWTDQDSLYAQGNITGLEAHGDHTLVPWGHNLLRTYHSSCKYHSMNIWNLALTTCHTENKPWGYRGDQ